jgi:hypothetical protein
MGFGVWGLGFGVWGMGPNPQAPIPNPQSPIPNPHLNLNILLRIIKKEKLLKFLLLNFEIIKSKKCPKKFHYINILYQKA